MPTKRTSLKVIFSTPVRPNVTRFYSYGFPNGKFELSNFSLGIEAKFFDYSVLLSLGDTFCPEAEICLD